MIGLLTAVLLAFHPSATQDGYFVNLDAILQISCVGPEGHDLGSGSIISHDRVLTAAHVVRGTDSCMIRGQAAKVIFEDDKLDVAVLAADLGRTPVMQVSCDDFVKDRPYFAIGYAQGQDFALQVLTSTGAYGSIKTNEGAFLHGALFDGRVFGGMSGGPVVDTLGHVIGVVVAGQERTEFSAIRALRDTPLCVMLKDA